MVTCERQPVQKLAANICQNDHQMPVALLLMHALPCDSLTANLWINDERWRSHSAQEDRTDG
jgi:hypothetical protein